MTGLSDREQAILDWYSSQGTKVQVGNAVVSLLQAVAASRPLQVALGLGLLQLLQRAAGSKGISDTLMDTLISGGLAGYLVNADGGTSLGFDVPDVASADPTPLLLGGGGSLPFSHR